MRELRQSQIIVFFQVKLKIQEHYIQWYCKGDQGGEHFIPKFCNVSEQLDLGFLPTLNYETFVSVQLPGGSDGKVSVCLQCGRPMFSPRVRNILWIRKWQPTPVLLPGKSHGQRRLVDYSPWGHRELDTTEQLNFVLITVPGLQEVNDK